MEDAHIANTNLGNGLSLFGVFDGHGGKYYQINKHFLNFISVIVN